MNYLGQTTRTNDSLSRFTSRRGMFFYEKTDPPGTSDLHCVSADTGIREDGLRESGSRIPGLTAAFPAPLYSVAVVHGQQKTENKAFGSKICLSGNAQILVATSVIEVGVDVPNATVMVIESAERFGLSQLHQLQESGWTRSRNFILHPDDRQCVKQRSKRTFETYVRNQQRI